MPNTVGVPTARSMGSAFKSYGIGFLGGAVYKLAANLLGNGLLASLAAPLLAGSVVKGTAGDTIATLAGFSVAGSVLGGGNGGNGTSSRGEM